MSAASIAAAKIYIAMSDMTSAYNDTFMTSCEPYRAVVDLARTNHMHNVIDGSEEYHVLLDCLETLVCAQ